MPVLSGADNTIQAASGLDDDEGGSTKSAEHRQRTESEAFEYQAFESDMESEGPHDNSRSSAAGRDTSRLVPSPYSLIKKTARARPESGLLPLRLSPDRPALADRTNVEHSATCTPPRKGIGSTSYSPYHLSPPAPLRIAPRKAAARGTSGDVAPVPSDRVFVDWDLEDEFASLELALEIGDEM